uniref:Uncharacterized protein n=1 Tax=uncultured prokaryote TaxID=198431 RepID=A0A0H5Q6Z1_9ZZZZ|nr:hypothetical protein [uncultured prokaryote]
MPITQVSAQVILRTIDNIPANFVTNTYFFKLDHDGVEGAPNDLNDITDEAATALEVLYKAIRGTLGGLMETGHRIKWVDIDGPRPQYPYRETVWDFDAALGASQLPNEVCVVSSFEGERVAGTNQASRRGRVFIGPMRDNTLDSDGRVTDAARTTIATSFKAFSDDQDTAGITGWQWVVYSRKLDAITQVVMGHVDNAFDTQRRRGLGSTFRSTWD